MRRPSRWTWAETTDVDRLRKHLAAAERAAPAGQRGTRETWIVADLEGGWRFAYRVVNQDGVPTIGEARVFPAEAPKPTRLWWSGDAANVPRGGVTHAVLMALPTGRGAQILGGEVFKRWQEAFGPAGFDQAMERRGYRLRARAQGRRRDDRWYAELARAYVAAATKDPHRPVTLLAREMDAERDKVRDWLHDARRKGLLTSTGQPIGGGALTEKAIALLTEGGRPRKRRRGKR